MASLKFPISFHTFDPNHSHLLDRFSPLSLATRNFNSLKSIKVSRLDTQLTQLDDAADYTPNTDLDFDEQQPSPRHRVGNKFRKKGAVPKFVLRRNGGKGKGKMEDLFVYEGGLDVNYSALGAHLSLDQCNTILRRLERYDDSKTWKFFEWMRSNGKLKKNVDAYCLVLRVLGRREDWRGAENMIEEMGSNSGCELDHQPFNTLIYACYKKGLVHFGAKWFLMMLELGVRPNIATFGMLMSLYKKGSSVEDAEFAFSHMRNSGIKCQSAYSAMITIYTRLSLYDKAEEVIRLLRDDKVALNVENWLVMLNAYCQQGKMEEAELMFTSMQEAGVPSHVSAYNTLITGYDKVSNTEAALLLFQKLLDTGLEPDEKTFRRMLEIWGRADNYNKAEWCYWELKRRGFQPNTSNLNTLMSLHAKHGDEEGAIRTLDDMMRMGCQYSSVLGIILHAYERVRRTDRVPNILKGSFYQHILADQTSCSILVMAYVKHDLLDDAIKVLQEKHWKDQHFEDSLYHLLICSCKDLGHLENAIKIYSHKPKSDAKQNMHIACSMIDIYSAVGRFTEAENIYLQLKSSGISLDMIGLSIVVRMYVKAGSLDDACSVLETLETQGIVPDMYLIRDMLRIYQRCGMLDKLADLYYKVLKSGVTWDQETYNCVINCCSRALPVDELSRLFDEMLKRGFLPNTITFNIMLHQYGKAKLFKKAQKFFKMARKRGLVDVISYNTLISMYGDGKDFETMSSTVREMQLDGFSVSLEAYNSMLNAYGKERQMENFREVLRRMKESSCASDHYTYNIMINIYGEQGWIDEVAKVLTELKECGLGPDLCSYNTLIKAYGMAGMVDEAMGLVKEMMEHGIEPDRITYTNMINALQRNDEFLEAVRWSLWMKQMNL